MSAIVTTPNSFVRRNGARGMTSPVPMTADQIRDIAPSVFATERHDSRSDNYTYISTGQIVQHLMKHGYGVFSAMQGGSRSEDKRGFTKHMLRLRPLDNRQVLKVGDVKAEIVLINSHDGTSAYRLMAGIFRLVCSNGLVVADSTISDVRVRHTGNVLEDVARGVEDIRVQLPGLEGNIQSMRAIELTPDERGVFARSALTAKYGEKPPVTAEEVLAPRRPEDRGNDLWKTLNVVQESLMRGGQPYTTTMSNGREQRRRTSPVQSVEGTSNLNRALWQLASEMRQIKTGQAA